MNWLTLRFERLRFKNFRKSSDHSGGIHRIYPNFYKEKSETCQHVTGWAWKHQDISTEAEITQEETCMNNTELDEYHWFKLQMSKWLPHERKHGE